VPVAGSYSSMRPEEERVPRMRHVYTYGQFGPLTARFIWRFIEAMDDDLNSPMATAAFFDYVNELYSEGIEASADVPSLLAVYRAIARHLYTLGCEFPSDRLYPGLAVDCFAAGGGEEAVAPLKAVIDRLLEARQQARKDRDFARSDLIREMLAAAGVIVEDTPHGPRWELA